MSRWNFRVVKHVQDGEEWYGIHEAYYDVDSQDSSDEAASSVCLTVDPVPLCANTLEELRERIESALAKPVLDFDSPRLALK